MIYSQNGQPIHSHFFGQSPFATYALCHERNVVKVPHDAPLELLGPLACGAQTGAGAVINALRVGAGQSFAVFGTGSVGMSAIMAARVVGATTIIGAQMQGRQMLNETMAEYSTLMLFREYYPPVYANRIARRMLDSYLNFRSSENEAELPVMYTENQGYLRAKGPLALYALQDIIGKEKVHQALRNFLNDYSFQTAPCPTSRDLVNALRAEACPEYQELITDLFERIVLYDLQVDAASAREIDGGYEVTIEVTARQFEANGRGEETEAPLDTWFDVALFPETKEALEGVTPLSIEKHRLHSGKQRLTVRTTKRPGIVALDPFHKRIERSVGNNSYVIAMLPIILTVRVNEIQFLGLPGPTWRMFSLRVPTVSKCAFAYQSAASDANESLLPG